MGPTSSAETCKGSNPAAVCWLAGEGGHLGTMGAKCAACRTVHECEGKAHSRHAQDFVFLCSGIVGMLKHPDFQKLELWEF